MDEIARKVRDDITGDKRMTTNENGKYDFGAGILVNKDKWDKRVKTQTKNSMFINKLSHAVYGPEGLKQRTVGIPKDSTRHKKMATPLKVDAIVACLRGKILAEHPNFPNVREAAEAARSYLSRKMQEAARTPKSPPITKPKGKREKNEKKGRKLDVKTDE